MDKARFHHQAQPEPQQTPNNNKLYLSSLPSNAREWHIRSHFAKYGEIDSVKIAKDPRRNFCKGYGSITFEPNIDIQRVLSDEHRIFGRSILCERFIEKGEDLEKRKTQISKRRIFVSNIPNWMSNFALKETLSIFGKVVSAYRIQKHKSKRQMPYGYVCFEQEQSAFRCLKEGFLFMGEDSGFMLFDQYTKDQRRRMEMKKDRDGAIQQFKKNRKAQQKMSIRNNRDINQYDRSDIGPDQVNLYPQNNLENRLGHILSHNPQQLQLDNANRPHDIHGGLTPIREGPHIAPENKRKVHPRGIKMSKKKQEEKEKKRRQLLFNLLKPTESSYWKFSAKRMKYFRSFAEHNFRVNKG